MKANRALGFLVVGTGACALAVACSQGPSDPSPEGRTTNPLNICLLDGAVCVDVPDANIPPLPPLPFDAGLALDVNLPPLPDVNLPPLPDGALPPLPTFDAGAGNCDPLDLKYADEFEQQLQSSGTPPTGCGSCAPTDCCYLQLACVPK
jgi:hypothetical protein